MMTFRSKSPEKALAEFHRISTQYGHKRIYAVDNIISIRYFKEVLPHLVGSGLDIFYETKSNLTEKEVQALRLAGVHNIQPGIEGLSTPILDLMRKGVKGYQNVELLKWCATYGVLPTWFYLFGFPHEPIQPYFEDAELMKLLVHLPPPKNPNPLVLDRFSPTYSNREELGLKRVRPTQTTSLAYSGLSEEERSKISYHFDFELPQGSDYSYANALWDSVLFWQYHFGRGARLYQFEGAHSTLVVDSRSETVRTWLITGLAHRVHRALRNAHFLDALGEILAAEAQTGGDGHIDMRELQLTMVASRLDAQPIEGTDLETVLAELRKQQLVVQMDGRYLALAVDCMRAQVAEKLGLSEFALRRDAPIPARPRANVSFPRRGRLPVLAQGT
jgi:hypothetical protein